jgi:hypothetical protein
LETAASSSSRQVPSVIISMVRHLTCITNAGN